MDIVELETNIQSGESETIEFKKTTGQRVAAAKTLCAFLNNIGGVVYFGVNDDGVVLGQDISDKTKREIIVELEKITPKVDFEIKFIDLKNSGRQIIAVHAVTDKEKIPYTYDRRAYVRKQSITIPVDQCEYEKMLTTRMQLDRKWDKCDSKKYNIDDLDLKEIKKCIDEGIYSKRIPEEILIQPLEKQLEKLNLIYDGNLNNAAIALFAKELNISYTHCRIKLGRFYGNDTSKGLIDEKEYIGHIFTLLNEAEFFLRRHLNTGIRFSENSLQRIDVSELPPIALREALLNALCHRDYTQRGTAITIAVFDKKVEIWNPGMLMSGISFDDLILPIHTSLHRNEVIAKVLYIRKYIEGWGTGTSRIIRQCLEHGLSPPDFSQRGDGFLVTFSLEKIYEKLSKRQIQILDALIARPLSVSELRASLSYEVTVKTLNRDLDSLRSFELVISTGAGRGTKWKRTT